MQKIQEVINGSFNGRALIETFIEGQEYGIESFVYNGKVHILAIMKKNMTNLPYRSELGHSTPSELPREIESKIEEIVSRLIREIGIKNGPVNMDMILSKENEPYIVDVGARMGGNAITSHIVPQSKGIDHDEKIKQALEQAKNEAYHLINIGVCVPFTISVLNDDDHLVYKTMTKKTERYY